MAFTAKDGSKHTNMSSMKHADAAHMAKSPAKASAVADHEDGEAGDTDGAMQPHHEMIHQHLQEMHAMTGEPHSHVEHHEDGSHTSHHVDAQGETHGPHDHANMEALKSHMDKFLGEEEHEGGDWDGKDDKEGY